MIGTKEQINSLKEAVQKGKLEADCGTLWLLLLKKALQKNKDKF
jgi:hypothetical protein